MILLDTELTYFAILGKILTQWEENLPKVFSPK